MKSVTLRETERCGQMFVEFDMFDGDVYNTNKWSCFFSNETFTLYYRLNFRF